MTDDHPHVGISMNNSFSSYTSSQVIKAIFDFRQVYAMTVGLQTLWPLGTLLTVSTLQNGSWTSCKIHFIRETVKKKQWCVEPMVGPLHARVLATAHYVCVPANIVSLEQCKAIGMRAEILLNPSSSSHVTLESTVAQESLTCWKEKYLGRKFYSCLT